DLMPLLFVTIACGAISGFHGMVSSGTSSKQLDKETDARFVGYFGAVGEGMLALVATIASVSGFRTVADWEEVYSAFGEAGVGAFVTGGGAIVQDGLGLPASVSATVLATMAVLFAATTMDTAVRLLRFVVQEAGEIAKLKIGKGVATLIVVAIGMGLTFTQGSDGAGRLRLSPLFGTSNQLLPALPLPIIVVMLIRKRRNPLPALVPLAFVFVMSFWAALVQLGDLYDERDWLLLTIDVVIIVTAVWVAFEALVATRRASREPPEAPDAD